MAAIVSKSEVEALLREIETEEASQAEAARNEALVVDPEKVYRGLRPVTPRYVAGYVSPVVKAREIVVNPDPATTPPTHKVVVRTLGNYRRYRALLRNTN